MARSLWCALWQPEGLKNELFWSFFKLKPSESGVCQLHCQLGLCFGGLVEWPSREKLADLCHGINVGEVVGTLEDGCSSCVSCK